ncbi:MAG: M55 family metallopeptidase [Bacteroidota bacterium]
MYHDMEGLSGEDDWRMFSFSHPEQYNVGRELLTADINAVVDGLYLGGAGVVNVVDAHGSGNPDPDVLLGKLDARAKMVERDAPFRQYVDIVAPNTYDAIVCVGMHAKTGSGGFASHTYTIGMDIIMNEKSITETELVAYSWGRVGVPVIMVSGDDKLAGDLKTMPWIEYVTVKNATSASSVVLRPVDEVHREMKAKAAQAVKNISKASVMKLKEPITAALHAVPPASLNALNNFPGIDFKDNTASFIAENFAKAYDGVIALISVATAGYNSVRTETIGKEPNGKELQLKIGDALNTRWFDVESGRWKPEPPVAVAPRKYYGAR